ncbi:MAG: hypothetical protein NZM11_02945 [Anaerolineales bacterium]|nr:hypothetical protein [Anaerolineales bacterium]
MTLPTLLFAFILSTLYGAGFHLWQGGDARRLLLYLLAGWLGFVLGHLIGDLLGIRLLAVGALNTFTATLGSAVALFAARLLALNETTDGADEHR